MLALPALWIIFWFLFSKHFVELGTFMGSWFAYKGLVFYKEFPSFHFPLSRLPLIGLDYLTNADLGAGSYLALFFGLLTLYPLYLFGRKFLSRGANLICLMFFALFYWVAQSAISYTYETVIGLLLAIALYLFFDLINKPSLNPKRLFIFGLVVGLGELAGQIVTITLATMVGLLIFTLKKHYKLKKLPIPLGYLLLGMIIPFAITITYFIFKNALWEFITSNTLPYISYQGSAQIDFWGLPFNELLAFYIPLLTLVVMVIFNLIDQTKKVNSLILALIGISTMPLILFGIYHPHHLLFALPVMALTAGFVYDLLKGNQKRAVLIGCFAILVFSFIYLKDLLPRLKRNFVFGPNFTITNDTVPGDGMFEAIEWMKVNSSPADKIMVVGDPLFYVRSNRLPASRPSEGIPHNWQPFDQIKAELEATPPKFWVVDDGLITRMIKDFKTPYMVDYLNETLNKCYKSQGKFGGTQVWQRICD